MLVSKIRFRSENLILKVRSRNAIYFILLLAAFGVLGVVYKWTIIAKKRSAALDRSESQTNSKSIIENAEYKMGRM